MNLIKRLAHILLWLLLFFYNTSNAQHQPLKFITYTTRDGLLHNHIKKCVEDPKGYIWVLSEIGLSRFDGVNFRNYQHDETDPSSLPHNTIHDLAIDNNGLIWMALENGLCYYNPQDFCFTPIDIAGTFTNAPTVLSLCVDTAHQAVWFMTEKGLFRFSIPDRTIHPTSCVKNPTPGRINSMYLSSDDRVWIALYRHGFLTYDILHDVTTWNAPNNWVMSFLEGRDSIMWISNWHSEQLMAWNMYTGTYQYWREKSADGREKNIIVTGITKSPFFNDSMLLLSTLEVGIRIFDTRRKEFVGGFTRDIFSKYSLPTDFQNYIFTDSRNILWVCTWEGLCKVNILEQQFRTLQIPFLSTPMFQYYNLVEGIVAADKPGTWWLGIDGCGVMKYDTAKKELLLQLLSDIREPNPFELSSWTDHILKTDDGVIWTVNGKGVASIKDDRVTQYQPPPEFRFGRKTVLMGPDQSMWITTATQLVNFDLKTKKYSVYDIDSRKHDPFPVRVVAESGFTNNGHLWTGTFKGLFEFNTATHVSERISLDVPIADSIDANTINSLVTDGHETIYMGTPSGLGIYNIRTKQYQVKGKNEHVHPILWKSMLRDAAGNIWIYTTHALFKYDPEEDAFSKFTTSDGIYSFSSDPTHLFSFRNNFYIGYRGVYTEFDPLQVDINQTMVKPLITDVIIGSELQKFDPEYYSSRYLPLPPNKNDITFNFTGIDYTNSDKMSFSYKLNNDEEWRSAGTTRSVTYTNLPPGRHTFQVRATNSSGILSDQSATFRLAIAPTLLQRWWFWPATALAFVALVIYLANRRVTKIREEERIKTATNKMLAELETKLLRSQMNPHFIFNSLNSIQKYIWENKEEDAAEYLARFAKLIRAILENSRKEFISLKEELDVLKLYVDLEHRRSNGKFDYHIKVSEDLNVESLLIPPLLLQPYVENAIWHGVNKKQEHGHIEISIQHASGLLEITIDDDGVGRQKRNMVENGTGITKTSIGSDITQQRITHLQTKSAQTGVQILDKVKDGIPAGTTVIITVPVKYEEYA